ncbi:MAG: formylglycine-generating enzyme family protein [Candidatus Eisenbacteria bacterium]
MLTNISGLARALLPAVVILLLTFGNAGGTGLSDVRVSESGGKIIVYYDLAEPSDGLKYVYDVSMTAVFSDSARHEIIPRSIRGNYGPGLSAGRNRQISWSILNDADRYLSGNLDVRLDATASRWRWKEGGRRRGTQLGFEILSDVRFEWNTKIESGVFDSGFLSEDFQLVDNMMYRVFLSIPRGTNPWEVGLSYGHHRSTKRSADGYGEMGDVEYFVVDGRIVVGLMWFGVGVGNYGLAGTNEWLSRDDWSPEYWYYEAGSGLRVGLGGLGALSLEIRAGFQKAGDLDLAEMYPGGYEESYSVMNRIISVRVGYSFKLGDFLSMFGGGGTWESLPTERLSGRARLAGLVLGEPPPVLPHEQPPDSFPQVAGLSFAYIPSGSYWVGTAPDEQARDDRLESDPFLLRKKGFFISTTEVLQQTYQKYVDRQWEHHTGPDHPAHSISYDEAVDFCNRLTAQDPVFVYSLPTEGEWEIACRGGLHPKEGPIPSADPSARRKCKQNLESRVYIQKQHAWFLDNKVGSGAFPVGLKRPNVIGLYDTLGNVAEWCRREEGAPAWMSSYEAGREPLRGGSILSDSNRCRAGARAWEPRGTTKASIGFRVVCRLKEDG